MTIETFNYLFMLALSFVVGMQTMRVRKYRNMVANADSDNIQLVLENEGLKRAIYEIKSANGALND